MHGHKEDSRDWVEGATYNDVELTFFDCSGAKIFIDAIWDEYINISRIITFVINGDHREDLENARTIFFKKIVPISENKKVVLVLHGSQHIDTKEILDKFGNFDVIVIDSKTKTGVSDYLDLVTL